LKEHLFWGQGGGGEVAGPEARRFREMRVAKLSELYIVLKNVY
jgi:hypothetical protein